MAFFYPKVIVKTDRIKPILAGHPWIFSNGIQRVSEKIKDGDVCTICSPQNQFLAIGYYNKASQISLRLLNWQNEEINESFFKNRISRLKQAKEEFLPPDTDAYRVVYGEGDLLPGLIIDKYGEVIVIQIHTLGMDRFRAAIVEAIKEIFKPGSIYERSDINIRLKEGLKTTPKELLFGEEVEDVLIHEYGHGFWVNIQKGQKTGFFLDQRENRNLVSRFSNKRRVLNCFAYTGGFSVYAACGGAKTVTSVDISDQAINYAKKNFELNGIDPLRHKFVTRDVFDFLNSLKKGDYDLIILDPPSFAKKQIQVKNAIKAYTTINSKALEKLSVEGILVSSSCTSHIDDLTFIKILHQASVNTKCMIKVLAGTAQPHDHTYNLSFPEGKYLKFWVLQKVYEI